MTVRRPVVLAVAGAAVVLGALALRPLLPKPPIAPVEQVGPAPDAGYGPRRPAADVDFADATTGYAVLRECVGPAECGWSLAATADGRRWDQRATPLLPTAAGVQVVALPGGVLLLDGDGSGGGDLGGGSFGPRRSATGWFSPDGGATWTDVDTRPDTVVDVVPDGAVLRRACRDDRCTVVDPVAVLPSDGRHVALPALPALRGPQPVAGLDGALALTGVLPGTGGPAVATSRDGGRSWAVAGLGPAEPAWTVTVGGGGSALHAAVGRYDVAGAVTGLELHTSVDGGSSWSALPTAAGPPPPAAATAGPGGRLLLVTDTGGLLVSDDAGRTSAPVPLPGPLTGLRPAGGGFIATTVDGWLRSTDGTTWEVLDPLGP